MVVLNVHAPMKLLIEDLKNVEKLENDWSYKFNETDISVIVNKILIQGQIIKTEGFSNEILLIDDGTGKAKITRKSQIPGDTSWLNAGMQCSIIGTLAENGKLPVIIADKIAKITNQILMEMWPLEVMELKGVLSNRVVPKVTESEEILSNVFI